ncbi:VQ motif-containing protein 33-like [Macadamia integrifolia]|uniref:VQ motif-containing protein 33-like n=1 Tax=Macadamia integrifolia TaxID=60698 RepID=UPI001C4FAD6B|nr:VQ motif-containing protein 33-like [Macadamia integrifolia]
MEKNTSSTGPPSPIATTATTSTTFVQADTHTFRELVQKLTGAGDDLQEKLPITLPARFSSRSSLSGDIVAPRRSAFKLQERRQNMRKLEIKLGLTSIRSPPFSPRQIQTQTHLVVSPVPSPVTPLGSDTLSSSVQCSGSGSESPSSPAVWEEEKAIAEKGFYLHPSPLSTPRGSDPPELLPLFPLSSPRQQSGDL